MFEDLFLRGNVQTAGAEVADVSEYLLICAARRRQRGFVITMCMALVVSEGRP